MIEIATNRALWDFHRSRVGLRKTNRNGRRIDSIRQKIATSELTLRFRMSAHMRYFKIRWLELVLGIGCLLVVVSSTGRACPACLGPGVPKLTLVQRLADCDQIIVAKATLQQPEYVTIETVIRGELRAGSILEIPRGELPTALCAVARYPWRGRVR